MRVPRGKVTVARPFVKVNVRYFYPHVDLHLAGGHRVRSDPDRKGRFLLDMRIFHRCFHNNGGLAHGDSHLAGGRVDT